VPGPRSWSATRLPYIWALLQGTIVHDFERLHREYGPVIRTAPDEVTFSDSNAWTDIFSGNTPFLKDPTWWKKQPGHPDSLLSAINPEQHSRMRKALWPGFTQRALRDQEPLLQKYVNLLVQRLREQVLENGGGTKTAGINMTPWFNYTTFDIFGELGFGESFNCLEHSRYHPWIALVFNSVKAASFVIATRFYPLLESLLMRCIPPSLRKTQVDHYQQIVDKVQRRLGWELQQPDIMSHLVDKNGKTELPLGELNATFMILTTAGSETTATALTGTLNCLVNNPDKMA
jgi:cytochrome P450